MGYLDGERKVLTGACISLRGYGRNKKAEPYRVHYGVTAALPLFKAPVVTLDGGVEIYVFIALLKINLACRITRAVTECYLILADREIDIFSAACNGAGI